MTKKPNRLINEKSPYLLQHAYNPVDWYPWGEEAFERALKEDKPVFLSIGYSTCHWCHVMEKETFEDEIAADLMNQSFINIKVDREERPDIDGIYMTVCQLMTGSGGWPLTIVMTPDKKPFFAATYIPKESKYNRSGMMDLIPRITGVWKNKRQDILETTTRIVEKLNEKPEKEGNLPSAAVADYAYAQAFERYDEQFGGFGDSPKFPSPHNLTFLFLHYIMSGNKRALKMASETLKQMRFGGIFDQVGKGFHRYSTDRQWLLPHFEKMLYDQATLMTAYSQAFQITGLPIFEETIGDIFFYLTDRLTSPEGAFYCAEDADSEGEEGKFYFWTIKEIYELLGYEAGNYCRVFNIKESGNFDDPFKGGLTGENIPHLLEEIEVLERRLGVDNLKEKISGWNKILFENRSKRVRPHKDDKILTDWNGLMISGLAAAFKATGKSEYLVAGVKAYNFIFNEMYKEGELLHRFRENEAGIAGLIDDYAFLINAGLELFEATGDEKYLIDAEILSNIVLENFYDQESGGFFSYSNTGEQLISRQKDVYDGAVPSGNSVMIYNLLILNSIIENNKFYDAAEKSLKYFSESLKNMPFGHTYLVQAVNMLHNGGTQVVVTGSKRNAEALKILSEMKKLYYPGKIVFFKDTETKRETKIPHLAKFEDSNGVPLIFVCKNFACEMPVKTTEEAIMLINS